MSTQTAALKAQFDLHTRLYNNATEGITDAEANSRNSEHVNHIKWIAGHLLNTRLESMSRVTGLEPDTTYVAQYQVENPSLRIREIIEAINVLEHNPMIGRPTNNNKRELIIGHRSHGYIALYRYIVEVDTVFILAVRSQKEAGYEEF